MVVAVMEDVNVPPNLLRKGNISLEEFDNWRSDLESYLVKYNNNFDLFLTGGMYSSWTPLNESKGKLLI